MGVIFAEYLTGSKPIIHEKYSGTYSAVADDAEISFVPSDNFTPDMEELVRSLLSKDPNDRPNIDEVLSRLPMLKPKVSSKPKIIRFEALKTRVIRGENACLSWAVENACSVSINGTSVSLTGTKVFPAVEKFLLVATDNSGKSINKTITIDIEEPTPKPTSILTGTMFKKRSK